MSAQQAQQGQRGSSRDIGAHPLVAGGARGVRAHEGQRQHVHDCTGGQLHVESDLHRDGWAGFGAGGGLVGGWVRGREGGGMGGRVHGWEGA